MTQNIKISVWSLFILGSLFKKIQNYKYWIEKWISRRRNQNPLYSFSDGQILWRTPPQVTLSESYPWTMPFPWMQTILWPASNQQTMAMDMRLPHDYISLWENLSWLSRLCCWPWRSKQPWYEYLWEGLVVGPVAASRRLGLRPTSASNWRA